MNGLKGTILEDCQVHVFDDHQLYFKKGDEVEVYGEGHGGTFVNFHGHFVQVKSANIAIQGYSQTG